MAMRSLGNPQVLPRTEYWNLQMFTSYFRCLMFFSQPPPMITITNEKPHIGSDANCKSARCSKSSLHFLQKFRGESHDASVRFWWNQEASVKQEKILKRHHQEPWHVSLYDTGYRYHTEVYVGMSKWAKSIQNIQAKMNHCHRFWRSFIFETHPNTYRSSFTQAIFLFPSFWRLEHQLNDLLMEEI